MTTPANPIDIDLPEHGAPALTPKQRMAIPRQSMPEQAPEVRATNFDEVNFGLTPLAARLEALRCLNCKNQPCRDGCPVMVRIPQFMTKVAEGDFAAAIRIIKGDNALPAVTGRVCPQEVQCEKLCTLGKKGESVAIGRVERFLADWERTQGSSAIIEAPQKTHKKVAIVGAGPAGLTAAADLVRMGHEVDIYEALHRPGGVLVYGIPEFRLPKAIVDAEVKALEKAGVRIHTSVVIGQTIGVDELLETHDALFVATGAGLPTFMNLPGENLNGVYSANEYLTRVNLMRAYQFPFADTPIAKSKRVAVVGGGNVAMDAARTAKRLGAEHVYLVYRRARAEMPARVEEIHHAEEEGIEFMLLHNPIAYEGDESGRVRQAKLEAMALGEPDASGRRRPMPTGEIVELPVDTVVVAIGNGPNPLVPRTTPGIKTKRRGNILAEEGTGKTTMKGVWAGGDIVLGAATVILAMGAGRAAARSIDDYLTTGVWTEPVIAES
ncbi:MAG: NADPH-dependent glutamate synthase [Myxococcales bacterium]|jgi:glutamate synthase (NADPH/NADH) small chain|nr:NADPH-dependent glutamate synthase [Myxococcales bacterium]